MNQTVLIILLIVLIILGVWQYDMGTKDKLAYASAVESGAKLEKSVQYQDKIIQTLKQKLANTESRESNLKRRLEKCELSVKEKDARILELEIKLDNKEQMIFMLNEELKRLMGEEHGETE